MLNQPGYGQIKRADTPINEIASLAVIRLCNTKIALGD